MKKSKIQGFTVIELLVSLAVIAILFSVSLAMFNNTREKTRDTKRVLDMREIAKALALYADNNQRYPISTDITTITGSDPVSNALETDGIIREMPVDPTHPSNPYTYQSTVYGDDYTISFCLETDKIENYTKGCGNTIKP